jgi:hypothetical protein
VLPWSATGASWSTKGEVCEVKEEKKREEDVNLRAGEGAKGRRPSGRPPHRQRRAQQAATTPASERRWRRRVTGVGGDWGLATLTAHPSPLSTGLTQWASLGRSRLAPGPHANMGCQQAGPFKPDYSSWLKKSTRPPTTFAKFNLPH